MITHICILLRYTGYMQIRLRIKIGLIVATSIKISDDKHYYQILELESSLCYRYACKYVIIKVNTTTFQNVYRYAIPLKIPS